MKKYKYTMKEIRNRFLNEAQKIKNDLPYTALWYAANNETIKILSENNRKNAIKKLKELQNKYKYMALSVIYQSAIKMLEEERI